MGVMEAAVVAVAVGVHDAVRSYFAPVRWLWRKIRRRPSSVARADVARTYSEHEKAQIRLRAKGRL